MLLQIPANKTYGQPFSLIDREELHVPKNVEYLGIQYLFQTVPVLVSGQLDPVSCVGELRIDDRLIKKYLPILTIDGVVTKDNNFNLKVVKLDIPHVVSFADRETQVEHVEYGAERAWNITITYDRNKGVFRFANKTGDIVGAYISFHANMEDNLEADLSGVQVITYPMIPVYTPENVGETIHGVFEKDILTKKYVPKAPLAFGMNYKDLAGYLLPLREGVSERSDYVLAIDHIYFTFGGAPLSIDANEIISDYVKTDLLSKVNKGTTFTLKKNLEHDPEDRDNTLGYSDQMLAFLKDLARSSFVNNLVDAESPGYDKTFSTIIQMTISVSFVDGHLVVNVDKAGVSFVNSRIEKKAYSLEENKEAFGYQAGGFSLKLLSPKKG